MCTGRNGINRGNRLQIRVWPQPVTVTITEVSRLEFDALKREVIELKKLLKAAKKFDEATGQPDCEMGEKIAIIRKVAEAVGVNLDEIFKPKPVTQPETTS